MKRIAMILLFCSSLLHAMDGIVHMPDEQTIERLLNEVGMGYLAQTSLIKNLANEDQAPIAVDLAISIAFLEHLESLKRVNPQEASRRRQHMKTHQTMLLEALLRHAPQALEELRRCGVYAPDA